MLMSKLYNKAKSCTASDPRVITPSSIPIFILPPTLDKIPNHKTELEDTFDCWSIIGEETCDNCSKQLDYEPKTNKSLSNLTTHKKISNENIPNNDDSSDFLQKKYSNQLKSTPATPRSYRIEKSNSLNRTVEPCASLENLQTSKFSRLLKQNTKSSQEPILNGIHRKSLDNSQPNLKPKCQNSTKSLVKNLFRSGFLNTNSIHDDMKTKENFCNLWVLHGDYNPSDNLRSNSCVNSVKKSESQLLKSASVNNLNFIKTQESKNEEQLQREYLVNLLTQLQNEEKSSISRNSSKKGSKYKKDKRSKSETLLTLNSLLYGNSDENKEDLSSLLNRKNSSRKRSANLSSRYLNVISSPAKNNYGFYLDVNRANSINSNLTTDNLGCTRRFSFRNLFKSPFKKKLSNASIDSQKINQFNLEIPIKSKQNSNQSLTNSSSLTSSSNQVNRITPVTSATGSVLKFQSFKFKNTDNSDSEQKREQSKAISDPTVDRLVSPLKKTNNLEVKDTKASFKSVKSCCIEDENDFDKIFNEYLLKNDIKRKDLNSLLNDTKNNFASTSATISSKSYKNIFKYLFRAKSNGHNLCENGFSENKRSRTLDSKRKMNLFKNSNDVSDRMGDDLDDSESESIEESVKSANKNDLYNQFSLNNFDLFQMEKENKRKTKRRKSSLAKSTDTLYIDAKLIRNNRKLKEKMMLKGFIDVSFEKLQQNMHGHLISINIRNFRVEPLIEINFIKAKLTYLTLELVEPDQVRETSSQLNILKKKKLLAKINKLKVKKCKFDNNLKNFSKPIDFDLVNEHFMNVTEEAMNLQMKKMFTKSSTHLNGSVDQDSAENNNNEGKFMKKFSTFESDDEEKEKKNYVFYLSIEVHSYIPVSRKILSSTFRKKKRIFKGQCQIHENFISSTQFTKNFILNEV